MYFAVMNFVQNLKFLILYVMNEKNNLLKLAFRKKFDKMN